jgi:uncharacterized protein (TIGR03066 family)
MKALSVLAVSLVLLGLTSVVRADDSKKDDPVAKLLGKWEVTKATDERLVGAIVTFEKEGKANVVMKVDGQETKLDGTYKVEKETLITEVGDNKDTNIIKKLTANALELENKDSQATTVLKKTK